MAFPFSWYFLNLSSYRIKFLLLAISLFIGIPKPEDFTMNCGIPF